MRRAFDRARNARLAVCPAAVAAMLLLGCSGGPSHVVSTASSVAAGADVVPEAVEFPSGTLRLHGLFWRPPGPGPFPAVLFNHGSGGATAGETAGMPITEAAGRLAPLFVRRGYAFFYPFRRGQGPSGGTAPFIGDVLAREERAHGPEARQRLQDSLLQSEQLEDVLAALAFLQRASGIDRARIALAGHSLGGQLTLLAAARDPTLRAAVTFAAAAGSWPRSAEVRRVLRDAVARARCPILLVQWSNDFSTEASVALGTQGQPAGPARLVVLYPPLGSTPEEGHDGLYQAMGQWEPDVFQFLDEMVSR